MASHLTARPGGHRPRLLGLFAHPDDEIFCVGGTFAEAAAAGADTAIVSFTKGEAGLIRSADIATRSTLGQVRAAELDAACQELGVARSRCLDFVDGTLSRVDRQELVAAAVAVIRAERPDYVYAFDETGAYGHPDHVTMSEVALAACKLAGQPDVLAEAGAPHEPVALMQACFPQNDRLLLQLLVDWLTTLDERFCGSDEFNSSLLMFADGSTMLGYAADHLHTEWFPTGSYIIEQGEAADDLYLVLSGSVDVFVEAADGTRTHRATAGPGEFLGEAGIATGQARNAHCVAAENTTCFVLSPSARSNHAGRGADATAGAGTTNEAAESPSTCDGIGHVHDVSAMVDRKVRALGHHRSQYSIAAGLFPDDMMQKLLGTEYFRCAWTSQPTHDDHR